MNKLKMRELRILMLEDREEDAGLITRELKKDQLSFISKRVDTRTEFVHALNSFNPDVILSDHALPQFDSIEALKLMKHQGISVPFILVTGAVSEEFAVSCLKLGADDYVLKSNLSRLPTAILQSLKQYEVETRRKSAENDLRKQNEELVKINRELDNLVYSVSHNLRAPLLSVLGLIQLAERDDKDNTFSTYFEMMTKSVQSLDVTLKEILNYSRNSRSEIVRTKINLKETITEMLERLQYLESFDQIQFDIRGNEDTEFYSDSTRISMILTNLLSNAIKYSNPYVQSRVAIYFSIDQKEVAFTISDNGIGINKDLLPRIFEMFFRATEKSDGAGLGLYIVKEAVVKLNGSIVVESEEEVATTFSITIPNFPSQTV